MCRVHFLAHYLSARLRALYTILTATILRKNNDPSTILEMAKSKLKSFIELYNTSRKKVNKSGKNSGEENNLAETAVNEKNSIFNRFHLECIDKIHDEKESYAGSAAYTDFFDQLLIGLLCSLSQIQGVEELLHFLFNNEYSRQHIRNIDIALVNSFTYDQLTHYYCLPFLRQMYIFRYYVLDNVGIWKLG